jgi:hypothetical protein
VDGLCGCHRLRIGDRDRLRQRAKVAGIAREELEELLLRTEVPHQASVLAELELFGLLHDDVGLRVVVDVEHARHDTPCR